MARTNIEKIPTTCQRRSPQNTTVSEVMGSGFGGGSVGKSWGRRGEREREEGRKSEGGGREGEMEGLL